MLPADCWPTLSNARLGKKLRYYPAARMCVPLECCHSPGSSIDVPKGAGVGAGISTAGGAIGAQQNTLQMRLRQFRVFLYFFPQYIYQCGYIYELLI